MLRSSYFYLNFSFFLSLFVLCNVEGNAQFTTVGFDLGYNYMKYEKGDGLIEEITKVNQGEISFNVIHRPIRLIGFGANIQIPVLKQFKWSFDGAPTSNQSEFSDIHNNFSEHPSYRPSSYEYNLNEKYATTFFIRTYLGLETNLFIDFRYSIIKLDEEFVFSRTGQFPENISYNKTHSGKGIGFEVGYNIDLNEGFFFKYSYAMDFYKFNSNTPSFSYDITYDNTNNTVRLESQLREKQISYLFNIGFGYNF